MLKSLQSSQRNKTLAGRADRTPGGPHGGDAIAGLGVGGMSGPPFRMERPDTTPSWGVTWGWTGERHRLSSNRQRPKGQVGQKKSLL